MESRENLNFDLDSVEPVGPISELPSVPRRRNVSGWIFLVLMFSVLFISQLHDYLTRKPSVGSTFQAIDADIKSKFVLNQNPRDPKAWEKTLSDLSQLEGAKASRYRASIDLYLKRDIQAKDIEAIRKAEPKDPLLNVLEAKDASEKKASASKVTRKEQSTEVVRKAVGIGTSSNLASNLGAAAALLGFLFLGLVGFSAWMMIFLIKPDWLKLDPGFAAEPLTVQEADGLAIRASQAFAALMVLSVGLILLLNQLFSSKVATILGYATALIFLLLLALFPAGGVTIPWSRIGISKDNLKRNLIWGFVGYTMNIPILIISLFFVAGLSKILPAAEHPTTTMLTQVQDPMTIVAAFFTACVVAPIAEEIIFRGLLLPALSRFWSRSLSVVVSSIVFAVIHPTGIPAWPALFGLAVVSSVLAFQTRSIVPSIVMHAIHNTMTLTMAILISRLL